MGQEVRLRVGCELLIEEAKFARLTGAKATELRIHSDMWKLFMQESHKGRMDVAEGRRFCDIPVTLDDSIERWQFK